MGQISKELGKRGEDLAADFLKENGYRVITRNFHSNHGEIDIVAQDGDILAFVEVKNYSDKSFNSPFGAITKSKRENMIKTAKFYLMLKGAGEVYCRFDVVAIKREGDGAVEIELLKDAFRLA